MPSAGYPNAQSKVIRKVGDSSSPPPSKFKAIALKYRQKFKPIALKNRSLKVFYARETVRKLAPQLLAEGAERRMHRCRETQNSVDGQQVYNREVGD